MFHKKCGGSIVMDFSGRYTIQSPSFSISTRGVAPGVLEITESPKKVNSSFLCRDCGDSFSSKEELEKEIYESCAGCERDLSCVEIRVTDVFSGICDSCLKLIKQKRFSSLGGKAKLIELYAGIITRDEYPTLLSILISK